MMVFQLVLKEMYNEIDESLKTLENRAQLKNQFFGFLYFFIVV